MNTLSKHTEKFPNGVGKLILKGEVIPLTVREVCNKIVHAQIAKIEWEAVSEHPVYSDI